MIPRTSYNSLSVPGEIIQTVTPVVRRKNAPTQPRKTPGRGLDDYEQQLAQGKYESRGKDAKNHGRGGKA